MPVTTIKQDLFLASEKLIVHGCNAQGKMASGVAKLIRERLPEAYEAYVRWHASEGLKLGRLQCVPSVDRVSGVPRIVGNAITQQFYGRDGRRYVSYDAIRMMAIALERIAVETQNGNHTIDGVDFGGPVTHIAIPRIGAGLGGGNWEEIEAILAQEAKSYTVVVYAQ